MSCPCYFIEEKTVKELAEISQNVPFSEMTRAFNNAHRQVLYKLIGEECLTELCEAIAAHKEDPETPIPANWLAFLEAIKFAAAYTVAFKLLSNLPTQKIVVQGLGLSGAKGVYGFEPATAEDYSKKIAGLEADAEFEIGEFKKWLEANADDYPCLPPKPKCPPPSSTLGMFGTAKYSPPILGRGCRKR